MKKVLAMLLASSMILSFAACGDKPEETTTGETTTAETTTENTTVETPVEDASLDFLNKIWNAYCADTTIDASEKITSVTGGDYAWYDEVVMPAMEEFSANNPMPSDDASDEEWNAYFDAYTAATCFPGRVAPEYDEENNTFLLSLNFPVEHVGLIDSAASVYNSMNGNMFTCAVYHVADSANIDTLANAIKTTIASTHWFCGQPEVYTIITVDNYVIAIYGLEMVADDISAIISDLYNNASVFCKEAVM